MTCNFVRTTEKKLREKFDKFRLQFVEVTVSALEIVASEKSQVHRMTPKWPWMQQGQRYPLMFYYCPRVPNFIPFRSTVARFPDNWGVFFCFPIGHSGEFEIFEKRIVKKWKLKNLHSYVRTIVRKIEDKFENLWLRFVGGIAFWFFSLTGTMVTKTETNR